MTSEGMRSMSQARDGERKKPVGRDSRRSRPERFHTEGVTRVLAFYTNEQMQENQYVGGAETRFESLVAALKPLGVEFVIVTSRRDKDHIRVSPRYTPSGSARFNSLQLALTGIRMAKTLDCDIVYCYHADLLLSVIPSYVVSLVCRIPLVVVVHDDAKRTEDSLSILGLVWSAPGFRAVLGRIVRRLAIRSAAATICVSRFTLRYGVHTLRARHPKLSSNGVSADWFQLPVREKKYTAVFVGRASKVKGIFTLLSAWKEVMARIGGGNLLIIGPNTYRPKEVKAAIDALDLSQNVEVRGVVKESELRMLVTSSRIFVLPSEREGYGLAVVEAMAAGLPCVLSDIPALKENFGGKALFAPVGDSSALADRIVELLQDEQTAQLLASKGRSLAKSRSWDSVAAREARIINEVAAHRARS